MVLDLGDDTSGPGLLRERAFIFRSMDFEENSGRLGGALRVERGWAVTDKCNFTSNSGELGSAIYVAAGGGLKLDDTVFVSNRQVAELMLLGLACTRLASTSHVIMQPCPHPTAQPSAFPIRSRAWLRRLPGSRCLPRQHLLQQIQWQCRPAWWSCVRQRWAAGGSMRQQCRGGGRVHRVVAAATLRPDCLYRCAQASPKTAPT